MNQNLTMDDVQRIIGNLYIENNMLREALAKAQQTAKVDADKGTTSKRGPGNKPRPLNAV